MPNKRVAQHRPAYLASLDKFGLVPTLDRINYMLQQLGHPQRRYPVVHIAGTNGKGSTARYISQVLQEAGLNTGLFTSPHLERYNERIVVGGREITDNDLTALIEQLKPLAERTAAKVGHPTEFEMSTALAFVYFASFPVDIAVIEVGMGGLWDSTNVVDPLVSVISTIGLDHQERLGKTLPEIAAQKAGIIKAGRPVVLAPQVDAALNVVLATAADQQSPVYHLVSDEYPCTQAIAHTDIHFTAHHWGKQGGCFSVSGPNWGWQNLCVQLLGKHQINNGALAAATCHELIQIGLPIKEEHVRTGLCAASWPGRLELMQVNPTLLLDGAHNAEGAKVLAAALNDLFGQQRIIMVIGALADKPIRHELEILLPHVAEVVCTAPKEGRTPPLVATTLAEVVHDVACTFGRNDLPISVQPQAVIAVQQALAQASENDVVCVCGSLHLVGEVRASLQ